MLEWLQQNKIPGADFVELVQVDEDEFLGPEIFGSVPLSLAI